MDNANKPAMTTPEGKYDKTPLTTLELERCRSDLAYFDHHKPCPPYRPEQIIEYYHRFVATIDAQAATLAAREREVEVYRRETVVAKRLIDDLLADKPLAHPIRSSSAFTEYKTTRAAVDALSAPGTEGKHDASVK